MAGAQTKLTSGIVQVGCPVAKAGRSCTFTYTLVGAGTLSGLRSGTVTVSWPFSSMISHRPPYRPGPEAVDSGFSPDGALVAMAIFMVIITIFLAGMVVDDPQHRHVPRTSRVQATPFVSMFQTMDKQIRYASSINSPWRRR